MDSILTLVIGAFIGFLFGVFVSGGVIDKMREDYAKSGVMIVSQKAYRVSPMEIFP